MYGPPPHTHLTPSSSAPAPGHPNRHVWDPPPPYPPPLSPPLPHLYQGIKWTTSGSATQTNVDMGHNTGCDEGPTPVDTSSGARLLYLAGSSDSASNGRIFSLAFEWGDV